MMSKNRVSELKEDINSNLLKLQEYSKTTTDKTDFSKCINNINDWVDEKKDGDVERIQRVEQVLKTTVNALEKFQTGDPYDITSGTLEIISSVAAIGGGPYGVAFSALCSIAGAIVSAHKPAQPSVVEQLAKVVHSELNNFHNKLQGAELTGLEGRLQRQQNQLRQMKRKEDLDDKNLWDHYDQFMGELLYRVNLPLHFKYEDNLEQDADRADFVRAAVTYCTAYTCFMALLTLAKSKFQAFDDSGDVVNRISRHINHLSKAVKETFAFLSEAKYLTFIGRLPSEGEKLTKILLLSRNPAAKKVVESVRRSLQLDKMADSGEVEEAAKRVSCQRVCSKIPQNRGYITMIQDMVLGSVTGGACGRSNVLFINETSFPMRIVSGTVGWPKGNLEFQKDLKPHSYYEQGISSFTGFFSTGGYMKIACSGELSSDLKDDDPYEGNDAKVFEFALSFPFEGAIKINVDDKTGGGRSRGKDAYEKMTDDQEKTLYWKERNRHYLARAEVLRSTEEQIRYWLMLKKINIRPYSLFERAWCFIAQEFDPEKDPVEMT